MLKVSVSAETVPVIKFGFECHTGGHFGGRSFFWNLDDWLEESIERC